MADLPKPNTPLSRREHEVLTLMAQGLDYIQVGGHLGISASTVGSMCMRAMHRTGTTSLFQLGAWAVLQGYTKDSAPVFRDDRCSCRNPGCKGTGTCTEG